MCPLINMRIQTYRSMLDCTELHCITLSRMSSDILFSFWLKIEENWGAKKSFFQNDLKKPCQTRVFMTRLDFSKVHLNAFWAWKECKWCGGEWMEWDFILNDGFGIEIGKLKWNWLNTPFGTTSSTTGHLAGWPFEFEVSRIFDILCSSVIFKSGKCLPTTRPQQNPHFFLCISMDSFWWPLIDLDYVHSPWKMVILISQTPPATQPPPLPRSTAQGAHHPLKICNHSDRLV